MAPAWAAHKNLPHTGKVLFALLGLSRWSDDLWLLTLQHLLLLVHTSGSTHHSQRKSCGLKKQSGKLCLCPLDPPTQKSDCAHLCYHKPRHSRGRTCLRLPSCRMAHVGTRSPSHIAIPVNGCCLGSYVMVAVPGSTPLLFLGESGYLLSAVTCCHPSSS